MAAADCNAGAGPTWTSATSSKHSQLEERHTACNLSESKQTRPSHADPSLLVFGAKAQQGSIAAQIIRLRM